MRYRPFLARYKVEHSREGWNARLLGTLYLALSKGDLKETLAFFDTNQDGVVTAQELEAVLRSVAVGESGAQAKTLAV